MAKKTVKKQQKPLAKPEKIPSLDKVFPTKKGKKC